MRGERRVPMGKLSQALPHSATLILTTVRSTSAVDIRIILQKFLSLT